MFNHSVSHSSLVILGTNPKKIKEEVVFITNDYLGRPRWSSGHHARLWIRGLRIQTRPGLVDFFRAFKNWNYNTDFKNNFE
jgi:hypothetical protein